MNSPKAWAVIINPHTLNITKEKIWEAVKFKLIPEGFVFQEHLSYSQKECDFITGNLIKQGKKNFIIVGGDGTLNEVTNAVLTHSENVEDIILALIPAGTGNDWSRTHHFPADADGLAQMFLNGHFIKHDTGKIIVKQNDILTEKFFVNIAGLGFDAEVIRRINRTSYLNKTGKIIYLKNLFLTLVTNKPNPCIIETNGKTISMNVFSIACGICKYNGGGMMQVPMANFDDGMLDVIIIEPMNLFEIITQLPKLYKGTHIDYKKVHHYHTCRIHIKPSKEMYAEVEGEIAGEGHFEIYNTDKKIHFLVP